MAFGVVKCGLMVVSADRGQPLPGPGGASGSEPEADEEGEAWTRLIGAHIRNAGTPMSVVRSYEHLGLLFNRHPGVDPVVRHCADNGLRALTSARKHLGSPWHPLGSRVLCPSSLVMSTLTCGGEFFRMWGGTSATTVKALRPLKDVLNPGPRPLAKASWTSLWDMPEKGVGYRTSTAALLLEFDLPSVHAVCAGKAARAVVK